MRTKSSKILYFDFSGESSLKIVNEYRAKYGAISDLLDANGQLLTLAHRDWAKLLSVSGEGRDGYTSEQLLRALIIMFLEGKGYRDTVISIDNSEFFQYFVRLGVKPTMDYSFLCKALCALTESTVEALNEVLAQYAVEEEKISGEKQRMDTTAYETNIHYPTDSSLLWDSFRTLARLVRNIQNELPQLKLHHRFHDRRIKKLATFIARNASSNSKKTQRKVKGRYVELIRSAQWIHSIARQVQQKAFTAGYDVPELSHYLPLVEQIINQTYQRVVQGVSTPNDEKLFSLFEEHTELLKRGKAGKPIEFGHKVLFCQTGEKFIHHYKVMPKRIEDKELLEPAIEDTFKNTKQFLGGQEPQTFKDKGPERAAGLSLWLYSMVWLWYLLQKSNNRYFIVHPWNPLKSTPSFADAIACLRRELWRERIKRMFGVSAVHDKKFEFLLEALAPAA